MKYMTGAEIRESYLKFFESKDHVRLPSASLIPNDPQLMFTVAGMVPFKPIFWGKVEPTYKRVATCQKCVRTNDIENVGRTPRHQTFFEMLGNFSFGDYFKREAIKWAWEYVTEYLKLPENLLWVSIYLDDDEAFSIWHEEVGISERKIVRLGKDDNWWGPAGPTGPCGPDSEIFIDRGVNDNCPDPDNCSPACNCGRFLEFWNLVFTEYNQDEEGNLVYLEKKNIDTGFGLDRAASIMQNVNTNFDTDMFIPIIDRIQDILSVKYGAQKERDVSIKVIADHARSIAFMISDGVLPSNEGRGYVLRRVLRRAVRHGSLLGYDRPFLYRIVETVASHMGDIYPELRERLSFTQEITLKEEERFLSTLENGEKRLRTMLVDKKELTGEELFTLHDTYGFPLELVKEMVEGTGVKLDREGYEAAMERQRERGRGAIGNREYLGDVQVYTELFEKTGNSVFTGYRTMRDRSAVIGLVNDGIEVFSLSQGETGEVVFFQTPFYPEKGGQVTDKGTLEGDGFMARVEYVFIPYQEMIVHRVTVERGVLTVGQKVDLVVDDSRRRAIMRNHTATHLLHASLRKVLGEHVHQSGSLVLPDRLRFDYSHFQAMSEEEIKRVEDLVNEQILQAVPVNTTEVNFTEVKEKDVMALFEEKYGDKVRVVTINDFSKELCGGTHAGNTGEIGLFKIISETSVSAGTRRIEAVTGLNSLQLVRRLFDREKHFRELLEVPEESLVQRLQNLVIDLRAKDKEIMRLKERLLSGDASKDDLRKEVEGVRVLVRRVKGAPSNVLRNSADVLLGKEGGGIVIIFNEVDDSVSFVVKVEKSLTDRFKAGEIAGKIARELGGGGGGKPEFAQAGGKDVGKLQRVINGIDEYIR
ncbi:MAG: alanine--tRNA ligase [Mesotoga sp.]|jgi:alanyl-tRNA synthetase|uniref:Alanine--tRNA ligase n=1 Tax=Mesotoga infera TaxID=1236046 RepID=A0A7Z7LG60_9BACT|nr:alanine--tRNA ligase [Mesotoga infera]MBP8660723.1 alanine--tRNA ligase [Mesotoga sp.]NLI05655.1 alanine--tRNA ligase [Thermotogaceae bacterium]SSC13452.1 Alanine--tRNA ligase [Mesotoga infera]HOI34567.1 alanine--tRNA ligase [Mesotoga infera]HON27041.1 alanine--tRNA ligase [Mesotoga infera]